MPDTLAPKLFADGSILKGCCIETVARSVLIYSSQCRPNSWYRIAIADTFTPLLVKLTYLLTERIFSGSASAHCYVRAVTETP